MNNENATMAASTTATLSLPRCTAIALLLVSTAAFAAGDQLGDGVCKLVTLLTGKWLFGFTILATLGGGAALMFGGEISDGLKKLATIITIVGIILAMSSLLSLAFSAFTSTC